VSGHAWQDAETEGFNPRMQILKLLRQASARFVRQAQAHVQAATSAMRQSSEQQALDALEAERLDRLRNPSKYLGKL
jgi:hypothetical protein